MPDHDAIRARADAYSNAIAPVMPPLGCELGKAAAVQEFRAHALSDVQSRLDEVERLREVLASGQAMRTEWVALEDSWVIDDVDAVRAALKDSEGEGMSERMSIDEIIDAIHIVGVACADIYGDAVTVEINLGRPDMAFQWACWPSNVEDDAAMRLPRSEVDRWNAADSAGKAALGAPST